jgi:chromosomal replication initiation ATPase DnaA
MWYEDLNFIENPFADNPQNSELVGYDGVVDELLYNIRAGNIVVLEGKEGRGKTTLLRVAINKFKGDGKVVYVNGTKVEDPNVERVLINKYGFFGRIFNKLPRNMILLMDEVEEISEKNLERIKYFYDQNYVKSIVFTSKDLKKINFSPSLKDRVARVISLKDLNEDDAVRIIKSRLRDMELFLDEDLKLIYKKSEKNVKKFLENCENIAKLIVERKLKKADKELIDEVLGEKKVVKPKKEAEDTKKKAEAKPEEKVKVEVEGSGQKPKGQIKIIYDDVAEKYY